ncbi:transcriptional regulator [Sphaerisporangium rufum]|uniref:Transcriptional regulator n=1 Tax=Sphaerisporangium rufum TaxID=1381558 RepID=A0A919R8P5_9ACTN|nr:helix-turn-helix transcriptional regulator [Sphaerisporangium rufum]GII81639.1 transcriptional regulator [Sphaerisporangium rufum]
MDQARADRAAAEDDCRADHRRAGPTMPRMLVGAQLRRLREARHVTRAQAGYQIRASEAKICRIELGRTRVKPRDVTDLLTFYGVTDDAERDALLSLVAQAAVPGWWHAYADVLPPWFESYIGLEQAATVIRTWEVQFVPGLLQTEEYARAVAGLELGVTPGQVERRVELRMRRQRVLAGPDPVKLWAVVDEAALRRAVGGVATMRAQIEHLIEAARWPNVTIQIMPFRSGGHPAAGGPISILRLPGDVLPDVVYLEQLSGALYPDRPAEIEHYWSVLNSLSLAAGPPRATEAELRRILAELAAEPSGLP